MTNTKTKAGENFQEENVNVYGYIYSVLQYIYLEKYTYEITFNRDKDK